MSYAEMNEAIFRLINDLGKQFTWLNPISVVTAEYTVYALALSMLVYWFSKSRENRIMVLNAGIAFIIAELFGKLAGQLYFNNQPFFELANVNQLVERSVDNSFPSDHTILFFSICFSYFLMQTNKFRWIWPVVAICVGLSRILVGVHYPGDVLVGAILGIGAAALVYAVRAKVPLVEPLLTIYEKVEKSVLPPSWRPANPGPGFKANKQ
ncbi:undecaprenyl-diphosphatase [Paenibacillus senegalensis]|uniref:undecaprenyl-diphosphatase n=1 Tax=Paenibacillus senegalensis TaxID=1465766 RepID=UPI000287AC0E|nr:undecaprenyl-diphosphatase [Paenibacillus senegalensis]